MSPLISCLMPTYNRCPKYQSLIEEAIESFNKQDYPNKELIILNDCVGQKLTCNSPNVKIYNTNKRLNSIGEKYNMMVYLSDGDYLCTWEDDDISLPWRLSLSMQKIQGKDYWKPAEHWMITGERLTHNHRMGVSHNQSLFTKEIFYKVKGYRNVYGQDVFMEDDIAQYTNINKESLSIDSWYYIYRWGVSNTHGSSSIQMYNNAGKMPVQHGTFRLDPHWEQDYLQLTKDIINVL